MSRRYIIGILIILIVCAAAVVLSIGYYPIAMVNGTPVSAKSFRTQLSAARTYARAAKETYIDLPTSTLQLAAANDAELARLVLDTTIENILVEKGLPRVVGENAEAIVAEKVDAYVSQRELVGASVALFGLSPEAFRTHILLPQAEREVLGSKLFLEGTTLDLWTQAERASAQVRIFSPRYAWDGTKVVAR